MIDKSRDCSKCVHKPICTLKKQREKETYDLEYRANRMENADFVYAVNCRHFINGAGNTRIIPQSGEPT
jgi:hypothetical protein